MITITRNLLLIFLAITLCVSPCLAGGPTLTANYAMINGMKMYFGIPMITHFLATPPVK